MGLQVLYATAAGYSAKVPDVAFQEQDFRPLSAAYESAAQCKLVLDTWDAAEHRLDQLLSSLLTRSKAAPHPNPLCR